VTDTRQSTSADSASAIPAASDNHSFNPALWLGILGLAFLFVLLRWNNFDAPLTRDEGEYAYAARLLLSGSAPYEHCFLQKPPMIAYSYALAGLLAPDLFWFPRILAGVFAALATVLLGYIARREFGPGVALPAMWLMTPMILLPELNQFIANTEMFMLLPLMATAAVYVHSRRCNGGTAHWLAAGVFAALTVCYKYTAFPLLAFVFVAWSFEEWRGGKSPRALAGHWLAALSGGTVVAAIVLAPFLLRDGGKRLWECTVVFNRYYAASPYFGMAGLWLMLGQFWRFWWILFLAPCFLVFKPERRVWFWAVLFLMAWLLTLGSHFGHYYIPIMPFWALLVAVALRGFAGWVAIKATQTRHWLRPVLAAIVVLAVCAPDAGWLIRTREQFAADSLGPWKTFLVSPLVAARLAQLTTARDFVYVAGSEPQILCYARRFSSTRFVTAHPLLIPTPLAKGCQAEAIHDLQHRPPAAIVLVRAGLNWTPQPGAPDDFVGFLKKLLVKNYDIVGGCLSDGAQARWREPLGREDTARCVMILFKRKAP
jgi:hypothetical protein